jgi:hypothetical protein
VIAPETYQDDDYLPEFGTLFVCDTGNAYQESGPFSRHELEVQPCGTFVRTGNGWLEGSAGDGPHVVRLESHTGGWTSRLPARSRTTSTRWR